MAASTWKGRIAFGMVSIPVRLVKAARRERIRFHQVYRPEPEEEEAPPTVAAPAPRPHGRVIELPAREAESEEVAAPVARARTIPIAAPPGEPPEPLAKERLLKGVEIEKDRYVVFDPREIAALRPRTSSELAIGQFVRLAEIDPVFLDTSYYVEPEPGGEKPYALLYTALTESGYAALGTFAMHGREHAAAIRPGRRGLILHTLFYEKEVRADAEYTSDPALASAKERQLAGMLVEALAGPFDPQTLRNRQEERLRELIESRASAAVPAADAVTPPASATPPVDIMEALRESIAAARKPPRRESGPAAAPRASARRPRKK